MIQRTFFGQLGQRLGLLASTRNRTGAQRFWKDVLGLVIEIGIGVNQLIDFATDKRLRLGKLDQGGIVRTVLMMRKIGFVE